MSASGWLAICLLLLSVSIHSYFKFCLLLGGNRDVLVLVDLGFEASPSFSSGFTRVLGSFGEVAQGTGRPAGAPHQPQALQPRFVSSRPLSQPRRAGSRKVQPLGASCSASSDTSCEFDPVSAPREMCSPGGLEVMLASLLRRKCRSLC